MGLIIFVVVVGKDVVPDCMILSMPAEKAGRFWRYFESSRLRENSTSMASENCDVGGSRTPALPI